MGGELWISLVLPTSSARLLSLFIGTYYSSCKHTIYSCKLHQVNNLFTDHGKHQELPIDGEFRCLRRKDLIDNLYAALPPATVKFGCQLESMNINPNTAKPLLRFIDGTSIIAKVVIGCDGGKSIIANFLNLKPTKMFPLCAIRGLTNYPNGHSFDHEFTRLRKDNILVGRIPMDHNLVYWFCAQPCVSKEGIWKDHKFIRQSTLEFLNDYPEEVKEMVENAETNSLSLTRIWYRAPWDLLMCTFCKGRVVVAGDAMHVMGPFLGQGGSAGLEDAVVLARTMAQMGSNRVGNEKKVAISGVEKAFNLFVKQQRMRVVRLSLQTYLTGMILGSSSRLKKVLYIVLLFIFFHNQRGHVDYDCGSL